MVKLVRQVLETLENQEKQAVQDNLAQVVVVVKVEEADKLLTIVRVKMITNMKVWMAAMVAAVVLVLEVDKQGKEEIREDLLEIVMTDKNLVSVAELEVKEALVLVPQVVVVREAMVETQTPQAKKRLKLLEAVAAVAAVAPMVRVELMDRRVKMEVLTLENRVMLLIQQITVVLLLFLEVIIPSVYPVVAP